MVLKRKNDEAAIEAYERSSIATFQRLVGLMKTQHLIANMTPDECIAWLNEYGFRPPTSVQIQSIHDSVRFKVVSETNYGLSKTKNLVIGDIVRSDIYADKSLVTLRSYQLQAYTTFILYQLVFVLVIFICVAASRVDPISQEAKCIYGLALFPGAFGFLMIFASCLIFFSEPDYALLSVSSHFDRIRFKTPPELVGNAAQRRKTRRKAARYASSDRKPH